MITLLILAHWTTPQNVERVWLATAAEVLTVDVWVCGWLMWRLLIIPLTLSFFGL